MHISDIPFGITDWSAVEATTHPGDTGVVLWRTCKFGTIRVRMVDYSSGYLADHWPITGASRVIFCYASRDSSIPNLPMVVDSRCCLA